MRRIPLISIAAIALAASHVSFAQDGLDVPSEEASTSPPANTPSSQSATPYSESFSSGEPTPAPPPVSDEATPEKNPDADSLNDASNDALPDNFRIGVTGALEIPHIVNFGIDALMMQKYGLSVDRGSVSRNINGIDVSVVHTDLRFRYHPWGGSFFAGVAAGQHILTGDKTRDISVTYAGSTVKASSKIKISAKSNYVAPHIGWFAIWEPGFTMGLDLGWLFPVQTKVTVDDTYGGLPAGAEDTLRNTPEYAKLKSDVTDSVEAYAKKSWPFMTMIRMGWMF